MLTIRKALPRDLDEIWSLVHAAVADMNAAGNNQWGADYPIRADYEQALTEDQLYVVRNEEGVILGTAVFNTVEEPQYAALTWRAPSPALVVHKVAVAPTAQNRGAASALLQYAFRHARDLGLASIRMDTYQLNHRMQNLLRKQGFRLVGEIFFPEFPDRPLPFLAYEKVL